MIEKRYNMLLRRLLVLAFLVGCLVTSGAILPASQAAPASSTNRRMLCFDGPVTDDCPTGLYCCDKTGCTCGNGN